MEVYKEQATGNYVCKICSQDFLNLQDAMDCADSHPKEEKEEKLPVSIPISGIEEYRNDVDKGGTLKAAERLCLSLIEDYAITRSLDLQEKGKVSPMTYNLGKSAAEALMAYNKIISGSKSSNLNVNIDASKKSDISALREILSIKGDDE